MSFYPLFQQSHVPSTILPFLSTMTPPQEVPYSLDGKTNLSNSETDNITHEKDNSKNDINTEDSIIGLIIPFLQPFKGSPSLEENSSENNESTLNPSSIDNNSKISSFSLSLQQNTRFVDSLKHFLAEEIKEEGLQYMLRMRRTQGRSKDDMPLQTGDNTIIHTTTEHEQKIDTKEKIVDVTQNLGDATSSNEVSLLQKSSISTTQINTHFESSSSSSSPSVSSSEETDSLYFFLPPPLSVLYSSASALHSTQKNQRLTVAGRALSKHGVRCTFWNLPKRGGDPIRNDHAAKSIFRIYGNAVWINVHQIVVCFVAFYSFFRYHNC